MIWNKAFKTYVLYKKKRILRLEIHTVGPNLQVHIKGKIKDKCFS